MIQSVDAGSIVKFLHVLALFLLKTLIASENMMTKLSFLSIKKSIGPRP